MYIIQLMPINLLLIKKTYIFTKSIPLQFPFVYLIQILLYILLILTICYVILTNENYIFIFKGRFKDKFFKTSPQSLLL